MWSSDCAQHTNNTLNQATTENWSAGQLQPLHLPPFYHLSHCCSEQNMKVFLSMYIGQAIWNDKCFSQHWHRTQCCPWASRQLLHRSLAVWLWLHCHGAFSQGNLHKCPVKPQLSVLCVISSERETRQLKVYSAPSAQGLAIPQECLHSPWALAPDPHWCGAASGTACELPLGLSAWCCYLTLSPRRCRGNQHRKDKRTITQVKLSPHFVHYLQNLRNAFDYKNHYSCMYQAS